MHVCVYIHIIYVCIYRLVERNTERGGERERGGRCSSLAVCKQASKQERERERERESARERERDKAGHLINRRVVGRAKCLRVVATAPMPGRKKREMEIDSRCTLGCCNMAL